MPNVIVGAYSGGDVGFPNISLPVPLVVVKEDGAIYTSMNVGYEQGANAQQINAAVVATAIARAAEYGVTVTGNGVIYQPFARG